MYVLNVFFSILILFDYMFYVFWLRTSAVEPLEVKRIFSIFLTTWKLCFIQYWINLMLTPVHGSTREKYHKQQRLGSSLWKSSLFVETLMSPTRQILTNFKVIYVYIFDYMKVMITHSLRWWSLVCPDRTLNFLFFILHET